QLSTSSCQLLIVVHTTKTYLTAPCSTSVDLSFSQPYNLYSLASCLAASQLPYIHSPCKLLETVHEVENQHTQVTRVVSLPTQTLE
ncbi:unnamed protein product, partial [Rotaria sp. Silwood2]